MSEPIEAPPLDVHDPAVIAERLKWADAAEALLRRVLVALGFNSEVSAADLLAAITAWLGILAVVKRDPDGRLASVWLSTFNGALKPSTLISPAVVVEKAEEQADAAVLAFSRRFPPFLEDAEQRDTADDLTALREALDQQTEATACARGAADEWKAEAEGLRAIADAAEKRAEKAERDLAEAQVMPSNTIASRPKPSRVEPGQVWLKRYEVTHVNGPDAVTLGLWRFDVRAMIDRDEWIYLGPASATEG